MELTELQEIINRHGKNLKQEVGLALSEQEAKDIIKYAISEVFSLHVVSQRSELLTAFRDHHRKAGIEFFELSEKERIETFLAVYSG